MSDSFADLWSSSAPSKPQNLSLSQQQKKPVTAGVNQQKSGQDLFSLLSSTSSTPNYVGASRAQSVSSLNAAKTGSRPITPSISGSNPGTRPGSSLSQSKPNTSNDAFGDLLSGINSSKAGNANMTMAERAALAQKQRLAAQAPSSHSTSSQSQWAGLDSLGGSSSFVAPSKPIPSLDSDDWGLGDFASSQKPAATKASPAGKAKTSQADDDDWGLGDFGNQSSKVSQAPAPTNTRPASQNTSGTLWDFEDVVSTPSKTQEHVDSPDFDFDFGNREYRETPPPQNGSHHDEDDVLGLLSKPVEAARSTQQQTRESHSSPASRPASRTPRGSSPPPHILGQIIEMGFSIPQAKAALARTESGVDVQAALDLLLAEANEPDSPRPRSRLQRNFSDDEPSRHQPSPPRRDENAGTPNAEKLIAQASEIGLSVLSKASLFWKEGKEKVQKAYEEANKNVANTSRDSRPRWLQEASGSRDPQDDRERPTERRSVASSFRDDDGHEESSAFNEAPPPAAAPPPRPQQQQQAPRRAADLLFSSEEPKAYVSPFRRKKADPSPSPVPAASPAPAPPRQTPPVPKPKPKRHLPHCSTSTLSRVQQHKTKGTDAFKLGQFSVAADEYTKAIALLPSNHLLLVPLQTNRAIAYIRCGECKSAIDDAGGALSIIGSIQGQQGSWQSWHPNDEDGGWDLENGASEADGRGGYTFSRAKGSEWTDSWGRGVDLKDGWVKAVKRRAEAFEGLEKWKEARKDWEVLAGGGGGGWVASSTRQEAVRGLGRCKKIIEGGDSSAPKPAQAQKPKPKPRPVPTPSVSATPGVAVEAYRAQINAQEAEDALKHSLKDNVEEKLLAWKKGKESNLRALLASLDTILWEEVLNEMGKKPGMADLVSAGGVKKWYMKAVSRVHPDKLNANNSTVEQRMIAGGVFGALNEAWLAFKP